MERDASAERARVERSDGDRYEGITEPGEEDIFCPRTREWTAAKVHRAGEMTREHGVSRPVNTDTPALVRTGTTESLAPDVFEVEFCDNDGRTYAMLALEAFQLMLLHHEPVETA